jgi:Spx/MgsR family transcriptional regulator
VKQCLAEDWAGAILVAGAHHVSSNSTRQTVAMIRPDLETMGMADFYWRPSCSTCRDARRYAEERGADLILRDLFKQPLSKEELRTLLAGRSARTIFSSRSPTVKKLGLNLADLTDGQLLDLMAEHPTLIRRPLTVVDGQLIVGFDRLAYDRQLASR